MRISDWSSDVCSSDLDAWRGWHSIAKPMRGNYVRFVELVNQGARDMGYADAGELWRSGYDMPPTQIGPETDRLWNQVKPLYDQRSEEHTSELQSLMRTSYAVFCLKKKKYKKQTI